MLTKCESFQIADYAMQPSTSILAEQTRSCLQESEDVPADITALFDNSLFSLDNNIVPKAIKYVNEMKYILLKTNGLGYNLYGDLLT